MSSVIASFGLPIDLGRLNIDYIFPMNLSGGEMNKKTIIGTVVLFFGMAVMGFVIHGVLLSADYQAEPIASSMRSPEEMMGLMWIYYLVYLVQSYVLSFIFFKGYEGKGLLEGARFGVLSGVLMTSGMAFATYAMYPTPFLVGFKWFVFGMAEYFVLGCLLALIANKVDGSKQAA